MLVISRKSGESFLVGEDIEIVVLEVSGDKIKVGINAPKDIPILRKEIIVTRDENINAAKTAEKEHLKNFDKFLINQIKK